MYATELLTGELDKASSLAAPDPPGVIVDLSWLKFCGPLGVDRHAAAHDGGRAVAGGRGRGPSVRQPVSGAALWDRSWTAGPPACGSGRRLLLPLGACIAERGGLVVLVGSSSAGKTPCAYEAVREVVPQWWLLHPSGAEQVRQAAAAEPSRSCARVDAGQWNAAERLVELLERQGRAEEVERSRRFGLSADD